MKEFHFKVDGAVALPQQKVLNVIGTRDVGSEEFETLILSITGLPMKPGAKNPSWIGKRFKITFEDV